MKLYNKITNSIVLSAFVGLQVAYSIPVFAQEYRILPPVMDNGEQYSTEKAKTYPQNLDTMFSAPKLEINPPLRGIVSTVPIGTKIHVALNSSVSSASNQIGEIFFGTLIDPVALNGNVVIPEGSEVIGQVTYIENAGKIGKNAVMDIKFTSIKLPGGQKLPIRGKLVTKDNTGVLRGGSIKKQIVKSLATETVSTAGGTLAGLGIGGIVGSAGTGAALGTAFGGVLGLGYIFGRKGKEVVIPSGTKMFITLEQPVAVGRD